MTKLNSTHLASCEYDLDSKTLKIGFRDGKMYSYRDVPRGTFEGLLAAPSYGQYFRSNIRDRFRAERSR